MPTIITHALLPLIASKAFKRGTFSGRLVATGALAAALPDADVIGFRLGIPYGAELGHRGASHSLLFAIFCGILAAALAKRLHSPRWQAFSFIGLAAASHGLADMLTNGGKGVALWWPLSSDRLFWPGHPVKVSFIGVHGLVDGSIVRILYSEFLWLILPAMLAAALFRCLAAPHIDLPRRQS